MEIYLKKLLFKASHRGTKEMDIILGNFAKKNLESMDIDNLKLFEELLEIPDPDLYKWFTSEDINIPEKFLDLVKEISK
jgi:antitoxin CptB|tara:strand:+ start:344 stop:580 length:237 start_codon:yes stop_codon:yes gene_type:complete